MSRSYFRDKVRVFLSRKFNYIFIIDRTIINDKIVSNVLECEAKNFTVFIGSEAKINSLMQVYQTLGMQINVYSESLNLNPKIDIINTILAWYSDLCINDTTEINISIDNSIKVKANNSICDSTKIAIHVPPPILPIYSQMLHNFMIQVAFDINRHEAYSLKAFEKFYCPTTTNINDLNLSLVAKSNLSVKDNNNIAINYNNTSLTCATTIAINSDDIVITFIDGTAYSFKINNQNEQLITYCKITTKTDLTEIKAIKPSLLSMLSNVSFLARDVTVQSDLINLVNAIVKISQVDNITGFNTTIEIKNTEIANIVIYDLDHITTETKINISLLSAINILSSLYNITVNNITAAFYSIMILSCVQQLWSVQKNNLVVQSQVKLGQFAKLSDYTNINLATLDSKMLQDVILIYK